MQQALSDSENSEGPRKDSVMSANSHISHTVNKLTKSHLVGESLADNKSELFSKKCHLEQRPSTFFAPRAGLMSDSIFTDLPLRCGG